MRLAARVGSRRQVFNEVDVEVVLLEQSRITLLTPFGDLVELPGHQYLVVGPDRLGVLVELLVKIAQDATKVLERTFEVGTPTHEQFRSHVRSLARFLNTSAGVFGCPLPSTWLVHACHSSRWASCSHISIIPAYCSSSFGRLTHNSCSAFI